MPGQQPAERHPFVFGQEHFRLLLQIGGHCRIVLGPLSGVAEYLVKQVELEEAKEAANQSASKVSATICTQAAALVAPPCTAP